MPKNKRDLEVENRVLRNQLRTNIITRTVASAAKYGGYVYIAYYLDKAVGKFAGLYTSIKIDLKGVPPLVQIECSTAIYMGVSVGGIGLLAAIGAVVYARFQRRLMRDTIERHSSRIRELEGIIDKRRTSSNLLPSGESRPQDRS